jgi:hypothetical protein
MNSKEFITWLKGFTDAINYIPTQAQWDLLKEKLKEIDNNSINSVSITTNGIITSGNTTWTNLPKGTNISYTANLPKELLND